MKPLLLQLGDLRFHAYPTMLSVAFLVCTLLAAREGSRLKNPVFVPPQGAVWALVGALFGAKIFWILQYASPKDLWYSVFLWMGGLVFYGGVIGATVFTFIYLRVTKAWDRRIADVCAPFLALGEAITRLGCFMNGCCWGAVCDVPWAVQFPSGSNAHRQHIAERLLTFSADRSLPVHPTQLYMTFGLITVCLILRWGLKRSPFPGSTMLGYCFLYGILRFTVEAFRGDSPRSFLNMTLSQMISMGLVVFSLFVFGAVLIAINGKGARQASQEAAPSEGV